MKANILKSYKETLHYINGYRARKEGTMFDSFYHEHLDFMEKSMNYMLEGETLLHVETEEKCPHCGVKLSYRIFAIERYVEKYDYFGDVKLKSALCCNCAEEIEIPSLEEYNKKIIAPLSEIQNRERSFSLSLIPSLEELNGDTVKETPVKKQFGREPKNPSIFEELIKPTISELEFSDLIMVSIKSAREHLYYVIEEHPEYAGSYSKFPDYMIEEMIRINAEVVLHLKETNLDITLLGLEYAKTHVYSERVKLIIGEIKSIPNYVLKMEKIYGEDWEKKFNEDWTCPKRLTISEE